MIKELIKLFIVAEAIPYRNFKDKINIVNQELLKNRHVEIMDELNIIYSARKRGDRMYQVEKNFREELIEAITIVATTTNMTVNECIKQAMVILEEEKEKNERYR